MLRKSTNSKSFVKNSPVPNSVRAQHDPLISCPIVCGEYMRTTGFFFRANAQIYLITARHNLLPTTVSITNPITGRKLAENSTTDSYSTVDIYMRRDDAWVCERIETNKALDRRLNQQYNLDIVALNIDFNPEKYGYRVWTDEHLSTPEEEEDELMSTGFDGVSFPPKSLPYSREQYAQSIQAPRLVSFENSTKGIQHLEIPHIGVGLDSQAAGNYEGLSGSPIIGDGLVGVHSYDNALPTEALMQLGEQHVRVLGYFRAEILGKVLTSSD